MLAWRVPCTQEPGGLQSTGHKEWNTAEQPQAGDGVRCSASWPCRLTPPALSVSDAAVTVAPCVANAPCVTGPTDSQKSLSSCGTLASQRARLVPSALTPSCSLGPHTLVPKSGLQHGGRETTALINKHFSLSLQLSESQKPPRALNLYSWNSLPDFLEGYDSISSVFPLSYLYINSPDDALYKWFC